MKRELNNTSIVNYFKERLKNIKFINPSDYTKIERWLDSLCDHNKKRYEKARIAGDMWKFFIKNSLEAITPNLRGYDELCRYFDDYAEYENLLFALDKNYRDHTIHSIWVMLLGFYLKGKCAQFKNMVYEISKFREGDDSDVKKTNEIIKESEDLLWCLISLTHDLGYPIEKTRKASDRMSKMIQNFGFLNLQGLDYSFKIVHQTAISELLDILSSSVFWIDKGWGKIGYWSGRRADFAKSFERLDHGIMSAYLLLMYLDWICDTTNLLRGIEETGFTEHSFAANLAIIKHLLHAISAHTNKNIHTDLLNSMDSLLFLSDELEEFSRYSRSLRTNEWIEVNCRTEVQFTANSFKINYTFDNQDIGTDIESFFEEKVRKIHWRFELNPAGITKISIICKDVRKADPLVYEYQKSLTKTVVRTPHGNYTDVLQFLKKRPTL